MKKFLSLVLALVMTMSLVTISAGAKDYEDGSDVNYNEAVDVVSALKVVEGYPDGSFKPAKTLTRAEAAKIICNMILGPTTAAALSADAAPFADVPASHWAAGYIAYCAQQGIINGYGNGAFGPNDTLTGYQFMKMLLTALGYDADIEGYVGANWSIPVAKQALAIELDAGNDDFDGNVAVTREEACLYAFNTLNTCMVKYDNKSTISVGDLVISQVSEAKKVMDGANDEHLFREEYFTKLKIVDPETDDFGRPATTWKVGKDEVGTYADTADASYTKKVDGATLYTDLGLSENIAKEDVDEVKDGGDASNSKSITKKDEDTTFGGNGVQTEVFLNKDTDGEITGAVVVEIYTYIGKIVDTKKNDDDERVIVIESDDMDDVEFTTDEFEEDDMVLFTIADDDVQTVEQVEKQTGKITKIVGSKYTIDGETYSLSAKKHVEAGIKAKDEVDFYVDAYGYIIKMDQASDDVTIDDLAYVLGYAPAEDNGIDDTRAKLLFADGTKKTVDVTKVTGAVGIGKIVTFEAKDDGYELELADSSAATVTKGSPALGSAVANSKTVYVYYLTDDGAYDSTKVYTGYKNAPTVENATGVAYDDDGTAVVVFVNTDKDNLKNATTSDDLTFIAVEAGADVIDDGDEYYTFNAVVDGKVTTLNVAKDQVEDIIEDTVLVCTAIEVDDGIVTDFDEATSEDVNTSDAIKAGDEVITVDGGSYAYANDVLVLVVDDNEFAISSVGAIKDKAGYYSDILYTLDTVSGVNVIDVIVLVKA